MNILFTIPKHGRHLLALAFACLFALSAGWSQSAYYVHFPNDIILKTCDNNTNLGDENLFPPPQIYDPTGTAPISIGFADVIYTSNVPNACTRVERTWTVINWDTYNNNDPLVIVPNPEPNSIDKHPANLPGPIVSAAGASWPWAPTISKIAPGDPAPTNFSTFWGANVNGYQYLQIILLDGEIICPASPVVTTQPGECTAQVDYTVEVNEDLPGWTLQQTAGLPSGSAFPIGTTINTFQMTDVGGTTSTCSFSVTVAAATPPTAVCKEALSVNLGPDAANDCYGGGVKWVQASEFDDGSYDDCGGVKLTVRRIAPYTDCVQSLNIVNGHPDCSDVFPDFPSEFENAISELDSIKFYCCESGTEQPVILRVYQLDAAGNLATVDGAPVFNECLVLVTVKLSPCYDDVNTLTGQVSLDTNSDCLPEAQPAGLPGAVVRAINSNGDTLYSAGSEIGVYSFLDPVAGLTGLEVTPPSPLWTICDNPALISVPDPAGYLVKNFAAQAVTECPMLNVNLATNLVRPCSTSTWFATYCNLGGATATDAYVQLVSSAPVLTPIGASKPYTIYGDTITVQLGDLAVGQCGSFSVQYLAGCDPDLIGTRACVDAHIYPDTSCLPAAQGWSGAQIVARGRCEGDSVHFTLENVGQNPTAASLDYVIIDDMVIMRTGQLPAGFQPDQQIEEVVVAAGESIRLSAEQEPGHPIALSPSVGIENCNGTTSNTNLFDFRNEDGDPFTALECREVVGSFDPNEKLAFPRGFSDQHYIEPGTPISYQINFQNTGNDTAFTVVLRDTLSSLLDATTLRMGPGSHNYEWKLEGPGILTLTFNNIQLPDSTTNEAASHGFVKFDIKPRADIELGSIIENRAGIYFDINDVVLTNTVWHTVDVNFVQTVGTSEPHSGLAPLNIWPNPASDKTFVGLDQAAQVRLIDSYGHTLRQYMAQAPGISVERSGLSAGVYMIEARLANGKIQYGKLIIR